MLSQSAATGKSRQKTAKSLKRLAGAGGFEPPYGGIKIRCLTTWLRPNTELQIPACCPADWRPLLRRLYHARTAKNPAKSLSREISFPTTRFHAVAIRSRSGGRGNAP